MNRQCAFGRSSIFPNRWTKSLFAPSLRVVFPTNAAVNWVHWDTAVKTVLIGSRSRIQIYLIVDYFASMLLLVPQVEGERKTSYLPVTKWQCVSVCVCPAGDHPSRKGWIWLHHLLRFPCEGAGCWSRQVLHVHVGVNESQLSSKSMLFKFWSPYCSGLKMLESFFNFYSAFLTASPRIIHLYI